MTFSARCSRRTFMIAGGAIASSLALGRPAIAQSGSRPLKIGLLTSLSGPFSALGESMRAGLQMLIAESGGSFAGRPIELIVEDDQVKPEEGVRKARKLVGQDRVDMICGVISSAVALAIRDVVAESRTLTFISTGSANALARQAASPLVFRPTKTSYMLGNPAGKWAYDRIARSGVVTFGSDYAAGREFIADFVSSYQGLGGTVQRQLWTPLGTADFGPTLSAIAAEKPKLIFAFFAGSDAVRFLRQMQDFRLAGRIPLLSPAGLFDQEDVLPVVGDASLGGQNTSHQSPSAPNPSAVAFAQNYRKRRGSLPGEQGAAGYATGQVMKATVEAVAGDVSNGEKVREALLERPVETVYGTMQFDPRNNQAILDIYVNEVRKGDDGKPVNVVVHTYKAVRDPGPAA